MHVLKISDNLLSLFEKGTATHFSKGQVVLSADSSKSLKLVVDGYVKRYQITTNGTLSIQSIYGKDEVFPLTHAFKILYDIDIYTGPETYYYEAMDDVKLVSIDSSQILTAFESDPVLYKDLLIVAADRFSSNIHQLENISLSVFYKRVAHQLLYYATKYGEKTPKGIRISIPLTQQDLADVISTTRETVSICMGQLKGEGIIENGKHIVIFDIDKLEAKAYGD